MAKPCNRCDEVNLSQRECPTCGGATDEVVMSIPSAPGGFGNIGPGPHHGWQCDHCGVLWDGGRAYGFACHLHGGQPPATPEGAKDFSTPHSRDRLKEDWDA